MSSISSKKRKRDVAIIANTLASSMNTKSDDPYLKLSDDIGYYVLSRMVLFAKYDADMDFDKMLSYLTVASAEAIRMFAEVVDLCPACALTKTSIAMHDIIKEYRDFNYPEHASEDDTFDPDKIDPTKL